MSNTDLPLEEENPEAESNEEIMSPVPGYNMSPIRPQSPEPNPQPVMPSVPRPSAPEAPYRADPTPTEEIDLLQGSQDKALQALERLRMKMATIAQEYSDGKLNRAQFHAIYQRYQEQRDITERLLKRDPKTGAWQTVVQPGHTSFLREHFQAKVESYSIYHIDPPRQLIRTGRLQVPREQVVSILERLHKAIETYGNAGMARRKLEDERAIIFVPGDYTVGVVVFSLEPALGQLEMVQDIHRDFELANRQALQNEQLDPREMVFPHRALFEQ